MTLRLSTVAVGALLLLGVSRVAHAQPLTPDNAPPAKRLEICIAAFEEAQLKQRRGDFTNARKLFSQCTSTNCPAQLRADCVHARVVVDQAVATASFVVRDAEGNEVPAKIKIDGVAQDTSSGHAFPVDPGEHDVEYTLPDGKAVTQKVVIHEGEKSRVVVLAVAPPPPPVAAPVPPAPCPPQRPEQARPVVGPLILAGAGALALIAGFGAYVVGKGQQSERDRLKQELATMRYTDETIRDYNAAIEQKNDAATDDRIVALLLGGTGVLCLGGAAVWFLAGRSSAKSSWHVLPQLGPSTAGASFGATF